MKNIKKKKSVDYVCFSFSAGEEEQCPVVFVVVLVHIATCL